MSMKLAKFIFWFGLVVSAMPGAELPAVAPAEGLTVESILAAGEAADGIMAACSGADDGCAKTQAAIGKAIARGHEAAPDFAALTGALSVENLLAADEALDAADEATATGHLPVPVRRPTR